MIKCDSKQRLDGECVFARPLCLHMNIHRLH